MFWRLYLGFVGASLILLLKHYYEIWPEMKNFTFHFFFIMKLWNDPGYHHFKTSVYLYWLLCIKWKYSEYSFSYNTTVWALPKFTGILVNEKYFQILSLLQLLYNSFHIHKILSILTVLWIYVDDRKFVGKNRGALICNACNIALMQWTCWSLNPGPLANTALEQKWNSPGSKPTKYLGTIEIDKLMSGVKIMAN